MGRSDRASGHSLVELLVALGLVAILGAGLLRIVAAFGRGLARLQADLEAQRSLRWAAALLSDDLQEAGFRVPCRAGDPAPGLAVDRGLPVPVCPDPVLSGGPARDPPPRTGDVLTLVRDAILPGRLELAVDLPFPDLPAGFLRIALRADRPMRLQSGDLLVVEDAGWEAARLEGPQELRPGRTGQALVVGLGEGGSGVFARAHAEGAPVRVVRPGLVVRYGLVLLGPGPAGAVRPALARLEAGPGPVRGPLQLPRGGPRTRVEGIAGFRVDGPVAPGGPVRVHLEARACGAGGCLHRTLTLARVPRNAPGPAP